MNTLKKSAFALAAVALLATACDGQQNAYNAQRGGVTGGGGLSKSDIGTGLGAVGGAVAGAQFGKGKGQLAATAVGTLLGAGIGHSIGSSLDRADMAYYQQTQQRALETGQPGQVLPWSNPQSGNSGTVTPAAYYTNSGGQYCREYNSTINVGGKVERGYGTACRQPDGSWQIVSQ
jgi:surface antigen